MTPELNSRIAVWRAKVLANTITEAEMAEAIIELRAGRVGASVASEKSRKGKVVAVVPDSDDLLGELGAL